MIQIIYLSVFGLLSVKYFVPCLILPRLLDHIFCFKPSIGESPLNILTAEQITFGVADL